MPHRMRAAALAAVLLAPARGYQVIVDAMSQADAQEACAEQYGTTLASIHSAAENALAVEQMMAAGATQAWIGLGASWAWMDGTDYDYDRTGDNCVELSTTGNWRDLSCSVNSRSALCNDPLPAEVSAFEYEYLGCWRDSSDDRAMDSDVYVDDELTNWQCVERCATLSGGYPFAGTEYSNNCFCGQQYNKHGELDGECDGSCAGCRTSCEACDEFDCSATEDVFSDGKCGGSNAMTVYGTGVDPNYEYVGCFADVEEDRVLVKGERFMAGMTVDLCCQYCQVRGTELCGLQYGWQCFCGDESDLYADEVSAEEQECDLSCDGDDFLRCGGDWKMSVYKSGYTCPSALATFARTHGASATGILLIAVGVWLITRRPEEGKTVDEGIPLATTSYGATGEATPLL